MNQKLIAQFEKSYNDKREDLFYSLLQQASSVCGKTCVSYKRSQEKLQSAPHDESWIKLTDGQEVCVRRCVDKFMTTRNLMDKILSESSSPLFYSEFLSPPASPTQ